MTSFAQGCQSIHISMMFKKVLFYDFDSMLLSSLVLGDINAGSTNINKTGLQPVSRPVEQVQKICALKKTRLNIGKIKNVEC